MKPVDNYGDSELEAGTAMMPSFTAFCQKGLKPNSPNQARGYGCAPMKRVVGDTGVEGYMCNALHIDTHAIAILTCIYI